MNRIQDLESGNNSPGGRNVDFQPPSGHLHDSFSKFYRAFMKKNSRRPGGLHLPAGRLGLCGPESRETKKDARDQPDCHPIPDAPLFHFPLLKELLFSQRQLSLLQSSPLPRSNLAPPSAGANFFPFMGKKRFLRTGKRLGLLSASKKHLPILENRWNMQK
jgi:hypothetical protein